MLVYRICKNNEVIELLNNRNIHNIANFFDEMPSRNTHKYNPSKKYIHFFNNKRDLFYFTNYNYLHICTYDIDDNILNDSYGVGYYRDTNNYRKLIFLNEYAVDCELLSFDNLIKIEKMNRVIDYQDYMSNKYIDSFETIYKKEENYKRVLDR